MIAAALFFSPSPSLPFSPSAFILHPSYFILKLTRPGGSAATGALLAPRALTCGVARARRFSWGLEDAPARTPEKAPHLTSPKRHVERADAERRTRPPHP